MKVHDHRHAPATSPPGVGSPVPLEYDTEFAIYQFGMLLVRVTNFRKCCFWTMQNS
jgi:hypothetical protein